MPVSELLPPPLVLIIDDEEQIRELYRYFLERAADMIVFGASSAADALRKLERVQPDAIVLDVALPDVSGLKLLEQIKKHPTWCRIPVLILTAYDLPTEPSGAARILSKPLRPADLQAEIERVLPPRPR